jgi:hypothetical protein
MVLERVNGLILLGLNVSAMCRNVSIACSLGSPEYATLLPGYEVAR